jgi:hypothetical protein
MESAFGVEHGEISKALGLPKGLRAAKGRGGLSTNYAGNRKMAHFTGRLIAQNKAKGGGVYPHAGQRYREKSRELVDQATKSGPRRKRVNLP